MNPENVNLSHLCLVLLNKAEQTLCCTKHYSYRTNLMLDNTFYVFTLFDIIKLPKHSKMNFQSGMSNFYSFLAVLCNLSGQQFQQIVPRYQFCLPNYLDIFKPSLNLAIATYSDSWLI